MNMDIKIILTEQELDLINRTADLVNRMSEQLPEGHAQNCAVEVLDSLHNLCDECYLDLQNGCHSSHPVSDYMWDGDEEEDDDDEYDDDEDDCFTNEWKSDDDNGCIIEIENPQDIPDDVWEKMYNILFPGR